MSVLQALVELLDGSTKLNGSEYHSILCGFHSLPRQFQCFDQIIVNSFDKILNVGFIKELVGQPFSAVVESFCRWNQTQKLEPPFMMLWLNCFIEEK
jgi:hypothetical protein